MGASTLAFVLAGWHGDATSAASSHLCAQQRATAIAAGSPPQAECSGDPSVVKRLTDLPVHVSDDAGGPGQGDIFLVSELGANVWL